MFSFKTSVVYQNINLIPDQIYLIKKGLKFKYIHWYKLS